MPRQATRRDHTDSALRARSSPSGFSRDQASRLGDLRTDSRGRASQPIAPAEQWTVDERPGQHVCLGEVLTANRRSARSSCVDKISALRRLLCVSPGAVHVIACEILAVNHRVAVSAGSRLRARADRVDAAPGARADHSGLRRAAQDPIGNPRHGQARRAASHLLLGTPRPSVLHVVRLHEA